ncbi:MAG: ATP-dependent sacrificial sulfur transferase LarE [Peptostreptococcaceae bacterium]|nr:ATP-dependent sacrificial sulfur transferase LarE [Peptostreptococcaceae bacterium]
MELLTFFQAHDRVAVAFSGGVDSTYLLYAAISSGAKVRAYYVKSAFQPQFEMNDAKKLVTQLNADMSVIEADVLSLPDVAANPSDRCYYCKRLIFSTIAKHALTDGYTTLIDGTNASDEAGDRPGMRALRELSVFSPLRECGLTKNDIRRLSKDAELFTWDKPAYACLATRIPTGEKITKEKLEQTEMAENFLFSLGFTDFRIRMLGAAAKIQLPSVQFDKLLENRAAIVKELNKYYDDVLLDLEVRA